MKKLVLIVLSMFFINAFSQKEIKINESLYVVLKFDEGKDGYFFENCSPTDLSKEEIIGIEKIIHKEINKIRLQRKKYFDLFTLKKINKNNKDFFYRRQYVPVINKLGEKEVYINCFCGGNYDNVGWRKEIQNAADGGNCFFRIKVNVSKKIVTEFSINLEG
jgi:hypothetical protein